MLRHVLVASDASTASDLVLGCVKDLVRIGTKEVTLAHVLNVRDLGGLYKQLVGLLEPKLREQARLMRDAGFAAHVELPLGEPFVEINRLADERECSAIVVASRGDSRIQEKLLGGTASSIIENAVVPVLVVRVMLLATADATMQCHLACGNLFTHLLVPTDFSETAERALQYVQHIVGEQHSAVTLLHVQDETKLEKHLKDRLAEFNQIDQERMERMKDRLLKLGASSVEIEIPYGRPTREIVVRAGQGRSSVIVMGSQGRGFLKEIFLGSVARNVVRHASLPVLLIPSPR